MFGKQKPNPQSGQDLLVNLLKEELGSRERLTKAADEQIKRVWDAYKMAAYLILASVGIAGTLVGIVVGKSWSEMKSNARTFVESEVLRMQNDVTNQLSKVDKETRRQIAQLFQSDSITNLVREEAIQRVKIVAEPLIEKNIAMRIDPVEMQLKDTIRASKETFTRLGVIQKESGERAETFQRLIEEANETAAFHANTILASLDNRKAYEALINIANDPTNKRAEVAREITIQIRNSYFISDAFGSPGNRSVLSADWGPEALSADMDALQRTWSQIPAHLAAGFIQLVTLNTNITIEQRYSFLRDAYLHDSRNSLQAANNAAFFMSKALKAQYNPAFAYAHIEQAWKEFSRTNSLFTHTNSSDLMYEIIQSTDLDKCLIVHSGRTSQVILLALANIPTPKTFKGMYFTYQQNKIGEINGINSVRRNFLILKLTGWNGTPVKFEFQYKIDKAASDRTTYIPVEFISEGAEYDVLKLFELPHYPEEVYSILTE